MNYIGLLFTPHSVRTLIVDKILCDYAKNISFEIFFRSMLTMSRGDVEFLYPKHVKASFFEDIVTCFTSGLSEYVLIKTYSCHQDISLLKGRFYEKGDVKCATGLRLKYQLNMSDFEFMFHSTDSNIDSEHFHMRMFGQGF